MRNLLVTGGAGFIGSNFTRYMLAKYPDYRLTVYDKLTYAGNLENLKDLWDNPRFSFVQGDIADAAKAEGVVAELKIDTIVNFAAETHVDRSLLEPGSFITTDVYGTYVLLEAAKKHGLERYHQVSTDEVYGAKLEGRSLESDPLEARSPYSASKAGADLLVLSYYTSFDLPVTITRGANNIGPYQYPEKVVPLFITNAIDDKPLPVYGDGQQMRDYQYVLDHCEAIDVVLHRGAPGQVYNAGSEIETVNLDMARQILDLLGKPHSLIQHVTDRPGHDRRYALDCSKIRALGWRPSHTFAQAIEETVRWYVEHEAWWRPIKDGEYFQEYYARNYAHREVLSRD
jgi:dTDP-glucose 4,6-dehydratase